MINITIFNTVEDLAKLTGLPEDDLFDNDFDTDDWDFGCVSDVPLTTTEYDKDCGEWEEPVDDAYWLVRQMENYCVGYEHIEYKDRHYYLVHHA